MVVIGQAHQRGRHAAGDLQRDRAVLVVAVVGDGDDRRARALVIGVEIFLRQVLGLGPVQPGRRGDGQARRVQRLAHRGAHHRGAGEIQADAGGQRQRHQRDAEHHRDIAAPVAQETAQRCAQAAEKIFGLAHWRRPSVRLFLCTSSGEKAVAIAKAGNAIVNRISRAVNDGRREDPRPRPRRA